MKETASNSLYPEINGHPANASRKGAGSKRGQVKMDKLLAEVERYRARIADNEERLRTDKAADGTPLTDSNAQISGGLSPDSASISLNSQAESDPARCTRQ